MLIFAGKSVYSGISMGPVVVLKTKDCQIQRVKIENCDYEIDRVDNAVEVSLEQLRELYMKVQGEVGEDGAAIFEIHQMLLKDHTYMDSVYKMICNEKVNAEYAVSETGKNLSEKISKMNDEYMKARAADIQDITSRLLGNLTKNQNVGLQDIEPSIFAAEDLSPSELMQLDKNKILALVMTQGSMHSHASILAQMMKLPTVIGAPMDLEKIKNGAYAVVDGFTGEIVLEPSEEYCLCVKDKIRMEEKKEHVLHELIGKENMTHDGRCIEIDANIGNIEEAAEALKYDADGIGLFRSEFLYLGKEEFPTEEEQFQVYKKILQAMGGKKVVIRTLDLGADKQVCYFQPEKETNPALGNRAIRICLSQPEIFKVQLRALFRAAVFGNLSVMYPMITSTEEVEHIYQIVEEAEKELSDMGIPYKIPRQGVMIETPAAVMISDELAEMVDFFSIGTNDLAQYTLAVDRQNADIDKYDPHHKVILKMIKMVVENAHAAGKKVGICGDLGADLNLTGKFINIGVDELSVVPSMVLKLRKIVREM